MQSSAQAQKAREGFFPVPEDFAECLGVPLERFRGPRKILVSLDALRILIGLAAVGMGFDEDFYIERHSDLREANQANSDFDARSHFALEGYFEHRPGSRAQAFPVDEKWYLAEYPDVADAIKAGRVDSATSHYFSTGRKEGRLPSNQVSEEVRQLILALRLGG